MLLRLEVTGSREPEEKLETLSRRGQLDGQRAPRGRVDVLRVREQRHRLLLERRTRGACIREDNVGRRVIDPRHGAGRREPFGREQAQEVLGFHPRVEAVDVHHLRPWVLVSRRVAPRVGACWRRRRRGKCLRLGGESGLASLLSAHPALLLIQRGFRGRGRRVLLMEDDSHPLYSEGIGGAQKLLDQG